MNSSHSDHDLVASFLAERRIDAAEPDIAFIELAHAVAAIPWGEARTVTDVFAKGIGTCRGKHRVFLAACEQLGIVARPVVCTFHWQEQEIRYPRGLRDFLAEHHWPQNHTFVQVQTPRSPEPKARGEAGWIDVDLTWDPALKPYGFWTFPEDWDGEHSFHAVTFLERWDGADIQAKIDELVNDLSPDQRSAQEHFLREV
ncbi:MAG: transglutaminase domain-containing protein, partial [Patescibacteria group bacterium]